MKNYLAVMLLVLSSFFVFVGVSHGECISVGQMTSARGETTNVYYNPSWTTYSGNIVTFDLSTDAACTDRNSQQIDCTLGLFRAWNPSAKAWVSWEAIPSGSLADAMRRRVCR